MKSVPLKHKLILSLACFSQIIFANVNGQINNNLHLFFTEMVKQPVSTKNVVDSLFHMLPPKISSSVYNHISKILSDSSHIHESIPIPKGPISILGISDYGIIQSAPTAGNPMQVNYSISNYGFTKVKNGIVKAGIYLNGMLQQGTTKTTTLLNLPNDSTVSGSFNFTAPQVRTGYTLKLYLYKVDGITCFYAFKGPVPANYCSSCCIVDSAEIDFDVSAPAPLFVDNDLDGIDDNMEHNLLEKFRPYFKFSAGEGRNPIDCISYLKLVIMHSNVNGPSPVIIPNSSLATDPSLILFNKSNLTVTHCLSDLCIGPDDGTAVADNAYNGATWAQELVTKNIGLYGHVVPIKLSNPDNYDMDHIPSSNDEGRTYYKIEYWQFYGYNVGCDVAFGTQDHQGDWTTVQLIIDPDDMQPLVVLHYAHGSIESRFCLDKKIKDPEVIVTTQGENVMRYEGPNFDNDLVIDAIHGISLPIGSSVSENELSFYQDPITNEWFHPVVYIEQGTHEVYPTEDWDIEVCQNHNGDGPSFLVNTPPNLGEAENPLNETPFSNIILQYNGYWGCWAGVVATSPPGPTLHYEWTWPASSSVRWLLQGPQH